MAATYDPSVFDVSSLEKARAIILTNEGQVDTDSRWATETPYLLALLADWVAIQPHARVLDFGCGIGRISKGLCGQFGCEVVGVDMAQPMRQMAMQELAHPLFTAISPGLLDRWIARGVARFDLCVSVWVLQHCASLAEEAQRLHDALEPGGVLFVVDMDHRAVPTDQGWMDDGMSVHDALEQRLRCVRRERFAAPGAPAALLESAWMALYQKPL